MPRAVFVLLIACALFFIAGGFVFFYTSYRNTQRMNEIMRDLGVRGGGDHTASD